MMSKGRCLFLLTLALVLGSSQRAAAAEQIVVPEVATTGVEQNVASLVTELILEALLNRHGVKALGPSDVKDMLNVEQQKMLMGCDQNSCMAELAGAMGANRVIAGMVGRLGSLYVVTLKLIDTRSAQVLARASRRFKKLEQVPEAVGPLVDDLLSAKPRPTTMAPILDVTTTPQKRPEAMSVRALCKTSKKHVEILAAEPWSAARLAERQRILEDTLFTPFLKQFDEKVGCIRGSGGRLMGELRKKLYASNTKENATDLRRRMLEWGEMIRLLDLLVEAYHVGFEKEKNGAGRRPVALPFRIEQREPDEPENSEAVRRFLDDYESAQKTLRDALAAATADKERTFRKLWTPEDPKRSRSSIEYIYKRVAGYANDGWKLEVCPSFVLSAQDIERSAKSYQKDGTLEGCFRRMKDSYVSTDRVRLKNPSGSKWLVDRW